MTDPASRSTKLSGRLIIFANRILERPGAQYGGDREEAKVATHPKCRTPATEGKLGLANEIVSRVRKCFDYNAIDSKYESTISC